MTGVRANSVVNPPDRQLPHCCCRLDPGVEVRFLRPNPWMDLFTPVSEPVVQEESAAEGEHRIYRVPANRQVTVWCRHWFPSDLKLSGFAQLGGV